MGRAGSNAQEDAHSAVLGDGGSKVASPARTGGQQGLTRCWSLVPTVPHLGGEAMRKS